MNPIAKFIWLVAAITVVYLPSSLYSATISGCDVVIIGGGAGGTHTAYQLTKAANFTGGTYPGGNSKVCLVEKNNKLGGRIQDVVIPPNTTVKASLGPYRVVDSQETYTLATELGVELVPELDRQSFRVIGGYAVFGGVTDLFAQQPDLLKKRYKGTNGKTLDEAAFVTELQCGPLIHKNPDGTPDYFNSGLQISKTIEDHLKELFGKGGAQFFADTVRFKGDYTSHNDLRHYLQYNAEDFASGSIYYINGGQSEMIAKMQSDITTAGGRIFLNQEVVSIDKASGGGYLVKTKNNTYPAAKVVIATEGGAIKNISGKVSGDITKQQQYKAIKGLSAITITTVWDRPWWIEDASIVDQEPPSLNYLNTNDSGNPVLRADTVDNCIQIIEHAPIPYYQDGNYSRTGYIDGQACIDEWLKLEKQKGLAGVQDQMLKDLNYLFPAVFSNSNPNGKPQLQNLVFKHYPWSWSFVNPGYPFSIEDILTWSSTPLAGENVFLVGDTWRVVYGWSNGAYMSSTRVLNDHFLDNAHQLPVHVNPTIDCDDF